MKKLQVVLISLVSLIALSYMTCNIIDRAKTREIRKELNDSLANSRTRMRLLEDAIRVHQRQDSIDNVKSARELDAARSSRDTSTRVITETIYAGVTSIQDTTGRRLVLEIRDQFAVHLKADSVMEIVRERQVTTLNSSLVFYRDIIVPSLKLEIVQTQANLERAITEIRPRRHGWKTDVLLVLGTATVVFVGTRF